MFSDELIASEANYGAEVSLTILKTFFDSIDVRLKIPNYIDVFK